MGTVIVYDKPRMKAIEDTTVTSGSVNAMGNLILATRAGAQIDAGNVKGATGAKGSTGAAGANGADGIPAGTTAQRDAIFGVPTTTAARVALANAAETWYNIDIGWFETYKATTGSAGLNVPGVPGASGWYQIGGPNYLTMPEGVVLQKTFNTNVTIPASGDFVAATVASFVFEAGRKYMIEWDWSQANANSNTYWLYRLGLAATTDAASSTLNLINVGPPRTKRGDTASSADSYLHRSLYQPSATVTKQLKLVTTNVAGGGTGTIINTQEPMTCTIFDVGAQTVATA
jgi:hypothetical protein